MAVVLSSVPLAHSHRLLPGLQRLRGRAGTAAGEGGIEDRELDREPEQAKPITNSGFSDPSPFTGHGPLPQCPYSHQVPQLSKQLGANVQPGRLISVMSRDSFTHSDQGLFATHQLYRDMKLPKNYRLLLSQYPAVTSSLSSLKQLLRQLEEECETLSSQSLTTELHVTTSVWVGAGGSWVGVKMSAGVRVALLLPSHATLGGQPQDPLPAEGIHPAQVSRRQGGEEDRLSADIFTSTWRQSRWLLTPLGPVSAVRSDRPIFSHLLR